MPSIPIESELFWRRWRRTRLFELLLWLYVPLGSTTAFLCGHDEVFYAWYLSLIVALVAYGRWGVLCPRCRRNLFWMILAKPYSERLKKEFACPSCGLDPGRVARPRPEPH